MSKSFSFRTYSNINNNISSIYKNIISSQESFLKSSETQLKEKKKEIDAWIKATDKIAIKKAEQLERLIFSSFNNEFAIIKECFASVSKFKSGVLDGLDKYRTEPNFCKILYTEDNLLLKHYGFGFDDNDMEIDFVKYAKLNKKNFSDLDPITDDANKLFKQFSKLLDNWINSVNRKMSDKHWILIATHDDNGTKIEDFYSTVILKEVEYISNIEITTNIFGR